MTSLRRLTTIRKAASDTTKKAIKNCIFLEDFLIRVRTNLGNNQKRISNLKDIHLPLGQQPQPNSDRNITGSQNLSPKKNFTTNHDLILCV